MTPSGMINNVSEYQFVTGADIDSAHPHGDLDRIIINGGIMPLRDETLNPSNPINWKKCLRGEDIAFLKEAVLERAASYGNTSSAPYNIGEFRNHISNWQINLLARELLQLVNYSISYGIDRRWLNSALPTVSLVTQTWMDSGAFREFLEPFELTTADLETSTDTTHTTFDISFIVGMFSDISKIYRLGFWYFDIQMETAYEYLVNCLWYNFRGTIYVSSYLTILPPSSPLRILDKSVVMFTMSYTNSSTRPTTRYSRSVTIEVQESECADPETLAQRVFSVAGISDAYDSNVELALYIYGIFYVTTMTNRTRWT